MTAPDSGLPRRLHDIWTDLLGDSDPDAGFLEAGGHSVLAARLIARIGAELDATLSLATLIRDNPSFHDLVAFVERARHDPSPAGPRPAAPESTADNHPEPAPISPAMRRIWTWHQLHRTPRLQRRAGPHARRPGATRDAARRPGGPRRPS